jgi:hypothetical protein
MNRLRCSPQRATVHKLKRLRGWRTSIGWNAGLGLELRKKIGFGPRRRSGCGAGHWNRSGITVDVWPGKERESRRAARVNARHRSVQQ